jgi:multicomponent Na+:H+ antiporter subunit G
MAEVLNWIGGGLTVAGVLLAILGTLGVLHFPDVYTRIHAASITDTGGATLVLLGLGLIAGAQFLTLKLVLVWALIMLTSPAAANALANAAYSAGHTPWIGPFRIMKAGEKDPRRPASRDGAARQSWPPKDGRGDP